MAVTLDWLSPLNSADRTLVTCLWRSTWRSNWTGCPYGPHVGDLHVEVHLAVTLDWLSPLNSSADRKLATCLWRSTWRSHSQWTGCPYGPHVGDRQLHMEVFLAVTVDWLSLRTARW